MDTTLAWLTNFAVMLVILGTIAFVHELGHFLVARFFDVKILVFSVGFGRRLYGVTRGETDYRICALPLGGYVKLYGEDPGETSNNPRAFCAKPRWQRFLIAVAGVTMNVILAASTLTAVYVIGLNEPAYPGKEPMIGYVAPRSIADKAGIQKRDRIREVNGNPVLTWAQVFAELTLRGAQPSELVIERDDKRIVAVIEPPIGDFGEAGPVGYFPASLTIIGSVTQNSPAMRAGIQAGDLIGEANSLQLQSPAELQELVGKSAGAPLLLTILRNGASHTVQVIPEYSAADRRWLMGIWFAEETVLRKLPFREAFLASIEESWRLVTVTMRFLDSLIRGHASPKAAAGPIGMTQMVGVFAQGGVVALLQLLALVSMIVGLSNLFPLPVLDGGLMLFLVIEGCARRDLNRKFKTAATQFFFVLFVGLAILIAWQDVLRSIK